MLIDALRPSLVEFVRQELNQSSGSDGCRGSLERLIEERLRTIEDQLASIKRDLDTRNLELLRLVNRLIEVIDQAEHRASAARSTLRSELLKLLPPDPMVCDALQDGIEAPRERSFG